MQEILSSGVEPDLQTLAVQYLTDFSTTLNELEVSFRSVEDSKEIIKGALQAAGSFYNADRVYVLEMDLDLQIGVNTYEWCSDDAPAALVHSRSFPLELMPRLEQYLKMNKPMIITDIERIRERYPSEYKELMQQDITSIIAAPYSKRINTGFIVVDNPRKYPSDPSMLLLLQYVIVLELNEIKQQRALSMANKRISQVQPMEVYINMFGQFEVISAQGVLTDEDFSAEQGCSLLAYMVLNRKMGSSVLMMCEALWPELASNDPYATVKRAVYRLRSVLGCIGLKDLILASHGTFVLNPAYTIHTDVERFDDVCTRISASSKPENLKKLYQGLIKLYRGCLLCGYDSYRWVLPKASFYQNQYLQQLKKYIELLNRSKEYLEVQRVAAEALTMNLNDGDIHYHMIVAMLEQGGHSVARMHYRQAEQYLNDAQKNEILARLRDKAQV